jgi:hypothetical protein
MENEICINNKNDELILYKEECLVIQGAVFTTLFFKLCLQSKQRQKSTGMNRIDRIKPSCGT